MQKQKQWVSFIVMKLSLPAMLEMKPLEDFNYEQLHFQF